jgi:cysteine desulfurase
MSNEEKRIYMDYQASTPVDSRVVEAMSGYLFDHPGNPHASEHAFGWEANAAVEKAATTIANALHVDRDEIIFTSGATEANNQAILGLAENAPPHRKKILISSIEHACVYAAARTAVRRYGCTLEIIPVDSRGLIDMEQLSILADKNTLLVSAVSVNNEIGVIQPTDRIGKLCRDLGIVSILIPSTN